MKLLLFPLLTVLFSYSHAAEMSCSEVFSIHNRKPPENRHGFQPTEEQIVQIFLEVQKIMDINVVNLRSKVENPEIERIILRITRWRKPLRSVYNYAMTLHSFPWWVNRMGQTVEQVYKNKAPLTDEQILTAIQALKKEKLSLKVEVMRGSEDPLYTKVISDALGFSVTPARLFNSTRNSGKSWVEWTGQPKRITSGSGRIYTPTQADIVNSAIQLELAGVGMGSANINNSSNMAKGSAIIYETIGQTLRPSSLYMFAKTKLKIPWRLITLAARQRMKEAALHVLIAVHHKPSEPWTLEVRPMDERLEEISFKIDKFKSTLSAQEQTVMEAIIHFYSSNNEWNPKRLEGYVRVRTGASQTLLDAVLAKLVADAELTQIASQL